MLGKQLGGGLLKVSVLKDSKFEEIICKEEIENACHKENKVKFSQMCNTSTMNGQLAIDLGYLEDSLACK